MPAALKNLSVISLERTPERLLQFRQLNPHLPHAKHFPAVDGRTVEPNWLVTEKIFAEPIFYKVGSIGNLLSHRELWRAAADRNEIATIFEDDAIVHKDFETAAPAMLADLPPDWHFVMWGWNFDAEMSCDFFPGVPSLSRFSQGHLCAQSEVIQQATIRPSLHRLHYAFGTVGYSVSPAGVRKIFELGFPIRPSLYKVPGHLEIENLSMDCHLSTLYARLNAYVCVPSLVITKNDHATSVVQEDWRKRRFWRIRRFKQRLLGMVPAPSDDSGFRLNHCNAYVGSREYTRKHAHYLHRNGDKLGAARKYLKHLFMRR
jgi:glycosyl transferase, family 25